MFKPSLIDKYTYSVVWSKEDNSFIASVKEFPSLKTNHDTSQKYALYDIYSLVKNIVKQMKRNKEKVPDPIGYKE